MEAVVIMPGAINYMLPEDTLEEREKMMLLVAVSKIELVLTTGVTIVVVDAVMFSAVIAMSYKPDM